MFTLNKHSLLLFLHVSILNAVYWSTSVLRVEDNSALQLSWFMASRLNMPLVAMHVDGDTERSNDALAEFGADLRAHGVELVMFERDNDGECV